jgi:hypothetical protein
MRLIHYADFTDYIQMIERRDNWTECFRGTFLNPEEIRVSLRRLNAVRLPTMHSRPLSKEDLLLLLVEARRVLKAIGALDDDLSERANLNLN